MRVASYDELCQVIESEVVPPFHCQCSPVKMPPVEIDQHALEENVNRPTDLWPMTTDIDGNCFPRALAIAISRDSEAHTEFRVCLVVNADSYLDHEVLKVGASSSAFNNLPRSYAMYSNAYIAGEREKLNSDDIQRLYETEVLGLTQDTSYCGVWQLHQAASVLGCKIKSYYPQDMAAFLVNDLARDFHPLGHLQAFEPLNMIHIQWPCTQPLCATATTSGVDETM